MLVPLRKAYVRLVGSVARPATAGSTTRANGTYGGQGKAAAVDPPGGFAVLNGAGIACRCGTEAVEHRSFFMMTVLRTAVCAAAIICFADTAPAIAKKARLVCEYGRCWQSGAGYDYQYGYPPPTKWEEKGFCPPGQAKKGNC